MSVKDGFRINIRHVDSKGNYSKLELLQRGMERGRHRLARLSSLASTSSDDSVQSPLHAGNGEFLMNIAIGTPPSSYLAIMDTGSDLIWTQCTPCVECYKQPTPIFDPTQSSSFSKLSCSSKLCKSLTNSNCNDGCGYMYAYGDYSTTQGVMGSETFTFGQVPVPNIGFGCGNDNEGRGFTQGAGLVGLGRGPLSLVSQLGTGKFSYCLTSIDDSKTSSLLFGSLASSVNTNGVSVTTPLIRNPSQPSFYYLSLEGITVGDTRLPIEKSTFALKEDGSGGVIIDSGTTITYLEATAFKLVKNAFEEQIKLPLADGDSAGLDLCFSLPSDTSDINVPKLLFHFDGADLDLPADNYMIADSNMGLMCLAMGGSNGMSIIGNVQQQNTLVLHDLDKQTMSFTSTKCDQL
ncbi:Aspartyl protease [Thalictrum thalictroides]|uniref:Aspartyl protease n=2 Tax=Thalictrum thalictroides TaxID=46969 RepID=A0A7J6WA37_THATH|nr:Aspartyl protease [Thalictrum thalictroides]